MAGTELKYDYNGDGKEDINDINYITQRNRNLPSELQTYKDTGSAIGAAGSGLIIGGAAMATGVGFIPGLLLAGASAGIGWFTGSAAGEGNWKAAVEKEKEKLTTTLKEKYKFTDAEVTNYLKTVDMLASVDEKTGGKVSQNVSIANNILQQARNVTTITGKGDGFNKITNMGFDEAINAVAQNIFGGKSEETYVQERRASLKKLLADNKININIDNVPDDKLLETVTNGLNKYLNSYGAYEFPNAKINYTPTVEEQNVLNSNFQVSINKIAPVEMGMAPNETSGTGASSTGVSASSTPSVINNGDGTTSTAIPNADGSFKLVKTDANGKELSTENISQVEAVKRGLVPNPFSTSGSTRDPNAYVGLNGSTNIVYTLDENGMPKESKAQYTYGQVDTFWNTLNETDRMAMKKRLYASGYYGASDIYSALSGNITEADAKALEAAMGDANRNGQDLLTYTQPKFETFLLTGRPVGEGAKDLNGDGIADETVSGALQSFFNRNGLKVTDNYIKTFNDAIVNGNTTLDAAMQQIRQKMLVSAYPSWKDEILSGLDIKDIASPYLQTMAKTLGISEDSISMNDPLIKKALSGADENGKPTYKSLYDFERDLRHDPRWQQTDEAQNEYANTAYTVLKTFGIIG